MSVLINIDFDCIIHKDKVFFAYCGSAGVLVKEAIHMNKKWTIFSVCALTAAIVIAAYLELTGENDYEAEEL